MKDETVTCCYCGKKGLKSEMNFFFSEYSHKSCDDEYFERQEKKVKYLDKLRSEEHF
jgi:hypothetical protein